MDWANEPYVRVYTRDTVDDEQLSWQARALWQLMLRKFDRAGVIALGRHGARGLASLVRMPVDVVESAFEELLKDGRVELRGTWVFAPNFLEAQDTPRSDAQRARDARANRAAKAQLAKIPEPRQLELAPVTNRVRSVTPPGPLVTLTSPDPDPLLPLPSGPDPAPADPNGGRGGGSSPSASSRRETDADLIAAAATVVDQFYGVLGRSADPTIWAELVGAMRREGYSVHELVAIAWVTATDWSEDLDRRDRAELDWALKPASKRKAGDRTPRQWLARADRAWAEAGDDAGPPPWRRGEAAPKNGHTKGAAA